MTGTFINIAAVLADVTLGLIFSSRFPARVLETVIMGLGLFTAGIGIQMFLGTENPLIVVGSLLVGGILGEWWNIETGLKNLGSFFERKFAGGRHIPMILTLHKLILYHCEKVAAISCVVF